MSKTKDDNVDDISNSSGVINLNIAECAFLGVGYLIWVFSHTVLQDQLPTIPNKLSDFKVLRSISLKESNLNVAFNTNALIAKLVALVFIIFACIVEFAKILYIVTNLFVGPLRIMEMLMGVCIFTLSILICFNILQSNSAFEKIVNNRVGTKYSLSMLWMTLCLTIYVIWFARSFFVNYVINKQVLHQSYLQALLGLLILGSDLVIYMVLYYYVTDG